MNIEVNTAVLHSEQTADYLNTANRWVKSGFRAALELLDIPLPDAAVRKAAGRRSIASLLRDYHADNPVEAVKDQREKLEAGHEASKARQDARAARSDNDILASADLSNLLGNGDG